MNNEQLEQLLKKHSQESVSFDESQFVSTEQFKTKFFEKAHTRKMSKRVNKKMIAFVASLLVVGVGLSVTMMNEDVTPQKSACEEYQLISYDEDEGAISDVCTAPNAPLPEITPPEKVTATPSVVGGMPTPRKERNAVVTKKMMSAPTGYSAPSACRVSAFAIEDRFDDQPMNTESYKALSETSYREVMKEPLSTFSADVDVAGYGLMRRLINQGRLPQAKSIRVEEYVNAFNYSYPKPTQDAPVAISTEIASCPWNTQHLLARIGIQAKEINIDALPPSNMVFLIDVSGSMCGEKRLPLVKESLRLLVEKMRPIDRVAIVTYASGTRLALPSTFAKDSEKIMQVVNSLVAGGGTHGSSGIDLAYKVASENFIKDGNNRVILATDGDFNIGQTSEAQLERLIESKRATGVYLTVLGYGMGNFKDATLQTLSNKGNGNYAYIDDIVEAKRVLVTEFSATLWTVAKDVKLQVEFNPRKVAKYRLVGYEDRRLANEDFANDKKDAGDMGAGHTVTALYELIPATDSDRLQVAATRYTTTSLNKDVSAEEFMTVNMRYKTPDGDESKLISQPVKDVQLLFDQTSDDFRFASAVAAYAQLLRNSPFKGNITFEEVIALAKSSKGKDDSCERAEFIRLVEKTLLSPALRKEYERRQREKTSSSN